LKAPLFRFLLVGGAAFVLDSGIVWGLLHMGLSAYVARAISLCVSVAFTFGLNRAATFQAAGPITLAEIAAYVGASGFGIFLNYVIFAGSMKLGLSWLPAMALGTGFASAFNFLAYGKIFKKG
jgi:putative flippase GtrA